MKKLMQKWSVQRLRALALVVLIFNLTPAFAADSPTFSLAWSEYPSWSIFGVAEVLGLLNGEEGLKGSIEEKWNVDVTLNLLLYLECMNAYGSRTVDAACLTNMDSMILASTRATVVPQGTSTSYGADKLIVGRDITDIRQLKGVNVNGEALSVAQYVYWRNVELAGEDPVDYPFANMGNADAGVAMRQDSVKAVQIWNPDALQLLTDRPELRVLADSRSIPGEVVDMIAFGKDTVDRPGGANFVYAVIDTYYEVTAALEDPEQRDFVTVELGKRFSNLNLVSMRKCLQQTLLYDTPAKGLALMTGGQLFPTGDVETNGNLEAINRRVAEAVVRFRLVESVPTIGYGPKQEGAEDVQIRFDPSYLQHVAAQR